MLRVLLTDRRRELAGVACVDKQWRRGTAGRGARSGPREGKSKRGIETESDALQKDTPLHGRNVFTLDERVERMPVLIASTAHVSQICNYTVQPGQNYADGVRRSGSFFLAMGNRIGAGVLRQCRMESDFKCPRALSTKISIWVMHTIPVSSLFIFNFHPYLSFRKNSLFIFSITFKSINFVITDCSSTSSF